MPTGRVITRLYPVQPSILDVIIEKEEAQPGAGGFVEIGAKSVQFKKADVKEFFEKAGVPFPQGTSITYNPTISQLIVANTPENLEVFERILARLNVIPNQVEIEARFVEISQDDLEELGFQWLLTDNWEIARRKGPFGAAASERIQMNRDENGLTKGLRFFARNSNTGSIEPVSRPQFGSDISPLGGIATFASVLTNPEVTFVLQALSQHGGADLLSAPRVTTRSGVNAQIQVVREIIYPTEFETTQPQFNESGNVTTPPVVTPGSFETRETGVILNVTPTVGPDGYTIDLVMVPEVSELVDWIQYGSSISIPRADPVTGLFSGDQTFVFNIPQPVFASRKVTTSIVIWDGQTVVMGGLIREDLVRVKDKVPLLGDLPLLGRFFRSEGEYSRKKNLLIFVTARLVDPAGKPINRGEIEGQAPGVASAQ
jgi:general secretion pathway protein D